MKNQPRTTLLVLACAVLAGFAALTLLVVRQQAQAGAMSATGFEPARGEIITASSAGDSGAAQQVQVGAVLAAGAENGGASAQITSESAAIAQAMSHFPPGTHASQTVVRHVTQRALDQLANVTVNYEGLNIDPDRSIWVVAILSDEGVSNTWSANEADSNRRPGGMYAMDDQGNIVNFALFDESLAQWHAIVGLPQVQSN